MFVFSKRRRAKRNPNVAVANARVVRFLGVLARLLHETKLLFEPTIVVVLVLATPFV